MIPEKVMECLSAYRAASGRCAHLKIEIERLSEILEQARNSAVADACIGAQQYTGMPHGSGVGDPTGSIGARFADGFTPEYVKELCDDIFKAQSEYDREYRVVRYVDSWLKALTNSEQFVIRRKVIDEVPWKSICVEYKELYMVDLSKDTLKRIRDRALCKIYSVAE